MRVNHHVLGLVQQSVDFIVNDSELNPGISNRVNVIFGFRKVVGFDAWVDFFFVGEFEQVLSFSDF